MDLSLESQVCSLELAKRLKELGVKQESLFYWFESLFKGKESFIRQGDTSYRDGYELACSAFTVAELGDMLPITIEVDGKTHLYDNYKTTYWHRVAYLDFNKNSARLNDSEPHINFGGHSEADARAKMLIYLIENKLIEVN